MAKGSVRKKGNKWHYRFYVENESGKQAQKGFAGTESTSKNKAMPRKAMENYGMRIVVAKSENVTAGQLMDQWMEEEVNPVSWSNGIVTKYQEMEDRIKQYTIVNRKLENDPPEHLQAFFVFCPSAGSTLTARRTRRIAWAICGRSAWCCKARSGLRCSPIICWHSIPCSS